MKSPSASLTYCISAGEGLMLFMLHSPHSATSCRSQMKHTLTCRLWKTALQLNTKGLRRNRLSTANHVKNLHSHLHELLHTKALIYRCMKNCSKHSHRHTHMNTKQRNPSERCWLLEIFTKLSIWVLKMQFFGMTQGSPDGKGHSHHRERENDAYTLRESGSLRCIIFILMHNLFIKATCLSLKH